MKENESKNAESNLEEKEAHLPSMAAAIHETIREDGQKELERDSLALALSALAAGLSIGISLLAKAHFYVVFKENDYSSLIESFGYTFGFIIVIMSRQQLFTENTITAVLPFMQKPNIRNFGLLSRLWSIVLLGNLAGTALIALAFYSLPMFTPDVQEALHTISKLMMEKSPATLFFGSILSGWLIATMVWMFPYAGPAKIWVVILMTYIISFCDLTHIVVGSVEAFYLIFSGDISWLQFIYPFALPTLAGNILGGTFIFALLSHAQIRSEMVKK